LPQGHRVVCGQLRASRLADRCNLRIRASVPL
jgi:hypothetical protein